MRFCRRCGVDTPREKHGQCKPCKSARMKLHRALEDKAVRRAYSAAWIAKLGNRELAKATRNKRRSTAKGAAKLLFQQAQRRAREKGLPFSLDLSQVQQKMERGICEVSGLSFVFNPFGNPYRPSIDQIHAGEGYTPENTRVVLWGINVACHTWGLETITKIFRSVP